MGRGRRRGAGAVVTLLVVLGSGACGGEAGDGGPAGEREGAGSMEAGSAEDSGPVRLAGFLTVEDAVVLTLCGTGEDLRVDGPAYGDLLDLHAVLAPGLEPLEGVFVDVLGIRTDASGDPGVEVLEVRRAAWEGGGCGDPEPDLLFRASGTEPFWSLTVRDGSMTWRTPEGERAFEHRGPYRSDRGDWLVDGTAPDPAPGGSASTGAAAGGAGSPALTARFYPEPCRDAMSGAWFHLSAEVALDGRDYRGCAYAGEGR